MSSVSALRPIVQFAGRGRSLGHLLARRDLAAAVVRALPADADDTQVNAAVDARDDAEGAILARLREAGAVAVQADGRIYLDIETIIEGADRGGPYGVVAIDLARVL